LFGILFSLLLVSAAHAAGQNGLQKEYQKEREACMDGRTDEAKNVCLKEAAAAYQAARQGNLTADSPDIYRRNALARCQVLPQDDREDCVRRVEGEGSMTSGSVAGGGIFSETKTVVPAPAPQAAPSAPPPPPEDETMPASPAGGQTRY